MHAAGQAARVDEALLVEGGGSCGSSSSRGRTGNGRAWFWVTLCVLVWVFLAEFLQKFERSAVHNNGITFLAPLAWEWYEKRRAKASRGLTGIGSEDFYQPTSDFNWRRFAYVSLALSAVLTLGEYVWYIALPRVSVTASIGIVNSLPAFVFVLSVVMLAESVTYLKLSGLVVAILGVVLIACSGGPGSAVSQQHGGSHLGYLMCVVNVCMTALYQVLYKKHGVKTDDYREVFMLLGAMGLWNAAAFWPLVPACEALGLEEFELPSFGQMLSLALIATFDASLNVFTFLAIQCSSPFFVSVALMLTIPTALAADMMAHGYFIGWVGVSGLVLVCCSFAVINLLNICSSESLAQRIEFWTRPRACSLRCSKPASPAAAATVSTVPAQC
eukprot:m51a1_g6630 hypothetical protein (387) ;mRNA; r:68452-69957